MGSIVHHHSWYRPTLSLAPSSNATQTHTDHFSCLSLYIYLECWLPAEPVPGQVPRVTRREGGSTCPSKMWIAQKEIQGTTLRVRVHPAHVTRHPAYRKHPVERHSVVVDENAHRLLCLNTWFPVGTVQERLEGVALLEELCHLR